MHRWTVVSALLVSLLLSSCSIFGGGNGKVDELEEGKEVWQKHDISDYQFDLDVACFCSTWSYPATIEVRSDSVATVLEVETGDPLRHPQTEEPVLEATPESYPTVEGLFEVIDRAIEKDYERLSVEYNDRYGYPEVIDYEIGENVSDDQVTYDVSEFEVN